MDAEVVGLVDHADEGSRRAGEWLDQVATSGGHRQFPPAELDELLVGIPT